MNGFQCCLRLSDLTVNVYDVVVIWSLSKHRALVLNVLFTVQCVKLLFVVRQSCEVTLFSRPSLHLTFIWCRYLVILNCRNENGEYLMVWVCLSPHSSLKWRCGYLFVFSGRMIASWNCSSRTPYKTINIQYRSHMLSVTMAWPLFNTSVVMFF